MLILIWTFTHFTLWSIATNVRQPHTGMSLRMQNLFLSSIILLNVIKISLINAIGISKRNTSTFWRHITLKIFVIVKTRVTSIVYGRDVGLLLSLINRFFGLETGGTFVTFGGSLLAQSGRLSSAADGNLGLYCFARLLIGSCHEA